MNGTPLMTALKLIRRMHVKSQGLTDPEKQ